ncbi:hypothetical protein MAL08_19995 (plasmid) [Leptospira noguchii]|uniref:hypothetical protein n=2 Tax=Leptospira noguchii TaxID=28182 RepID=UPI0002BD6F5E|nr:hypothetical protein [Leptospira noguchii]EMI71699.1 hypothetical protein LEP1GSC072_1093 [Leptospira noguchii str. Bonito]UOG40028.1 hypothetical protein MAL08_19995 [Leptospira noguchii]
MMIKKYLLLSRLESTVDYSDALDAIKKESILETILGSLAIDNDNIIARRQRIDSRLAFYITVIGIILPLLIPNLPKNNDLCIVMLNTVMILWITLSLLYGIFLYFPRSNYSSHDLMESVKLGNKNSHSEYLRDKINVEMTIIADKELDLERYNTILKLFFINLVGISIAALLFVFLPKDQTAESGLKNLVERVDTIELKIMNIEQKLEHANVRKRRPKKEKR